MRKLRGVGIAAGFALAGVLTSLGGVTATQTDDTDVNVTGAVQVTSNPAPVRAHATPLIARNPVTGVLAVAEVNLRGDQRTCSVSVSHDDGRTWRDAAEIMVEPYTDCSAGAEYGTHVTPFYAPDGTLYVAFIANDPEAFATEAREPTEEYPRERSFIPRNVYLARSTDDGVTFDTEMVFDAPRGEPHQGYNYAPVGAVDPTESDRVYIGWAQGEWQSPEEPVKAVVAMSDDGGRSFAAPVDISEDQDGQKHGSEHPSIAVSEDGSVHAVYWSKGFGEPLPEEDPPFIPIARKEPNPIYHMTSGDHGQTWQRTEIDPGNQAYYRPPVIATGQDDTVYVAWYANPEPRNWQERTAGNDRTNVYLRVSRDGGDSWDPKQQINEDDENATNQELPGLSVSPDGRVDLAWHDFGNSPTPARNSGSDDGLQDISYTFSQDQGRTFRPAVRVNDRTIDRSIGTWTNNVNAQTAVGVASAPESAYFVWQDTRHGDEETQAEDAYTAVAQLSGDGGSSAAAATLPWWAAGLAGAALGLGLAMMVASLLTRRLNAAT